ncbi:MAG: phosphoribosyltransferase family protein [Veillonella sp.]|nr:phosphoribosyltransferase family protein [Veillonella sp.]
MIYDVKFNEKKEQSKGAAPFLASYNFYMNYDESNIVQGNCKTIYDYIVPVPSSEMKKKKRGYNQVDLFFKKWAYSLEKIDKPYFVWLDCIYKFDTSNDMWSLTHKERHQNIENAFVIKAEYKDIDFSTKRILIVDDIYTTGATIEAVAKVLRSYNPSRLDALTLASGSF